MKIRTTALLLLGFILFCSHDMYLKLDTYFLQPHQASTIDLYNGTFEKSDNVIDRDRMIDASIVGNGKRTRMTDDQWTEKDSSITILHFTTGDPGTWVAGLSTRSRDFEMSAEDFNSYLEHDGVLDMLQYRKDNNTINDPANERYSKHVKAIYQVGDQTSDDWATELGYPIEFVPLSNPYEKHTGDQLQVKLLFGGQPLTNQLVYADYRPTAHGHSHGDEEHSHSHDHDDAHSHDEDEPHTHTSGQQLRTDDRGVVSVDLSADGIWYLRTIHLVHNTDEGLTHESNWATLTFEVTHDHSDDHAHHDHSEGGIPSYVYWIGSLLLVGALFFYFSKNQG